MLAAVTQAYDPAIKAANDLAAAQAKEAAASAAAAAAAAQAQAQAARNYDLLQRSIDPAYAAQARFDDEMAKAKAVLDAVGASEADRARVLAAVTQAYDPAIKAANDLAAAQAKEAAASAAAAAAAAQAQAAAARNYDLLQRSIDPAYAAQARFDDEMAKAKAVLDAVGASEENRSRILVGVAQAYDPAIKAARDLAAAQAKEAADFSALKASIDPVYAAELRLAEARKTLTAAHANGLITDEEQAAMLRRLGDGAAFSKTQVQILQSGFINFFQSVGAGLPLGQVALTQALQTAPAFANVAATAALVAGPLLAIGAAAAVVGSRIASMNSETRAFAVELKTLNPLAGVTADQLRNIGFAVADQDHISRTDANSALSAIVAVRNNNSSAALIQQEAALAGDVAAAKGGDIAGWATKLAEGLAGGAAGVRALDQELKFLTPDEYASVLVMDQHNQRLQVIQTAVAALQRQYGGAAKSIKSDLGDAFHDVARAWDEMVDHIAKTDWAQKAARSVANSFTDIAKWAANDPGAKAANASKALLVDAANGGPSIFGVSTDKLFSQMVDGVTGALEAYAGRQNTGGPTITWTPLSPAANGNTASYLGNSYGDLTKEDRDYLQGLTEDYTRNAQALAANANERQAAIARITAEKEALDKGRTATAAKAAGDIAAAGVVAQLRTAYDDNYQVQKLTLSGNLAVAQAYDISTAAGLKEATVLQVAKEALTNKIIAENQEAEVQRRLKLAAGESYVALAQQMAQLQVSTAQQTALAGASALGARAVTDLTIAIQAETMVEKARNDALAAGMPLTAQDIDLRRKKIEASLQQQELDRETAAANAALRSANDNNAYLQTEIATLGMDSAARAVLLARMKEEQQLREQQPVLFDKETGAANATARALIDAAGQTAALTVEQERLTAAYQTFSDLGNSTFDAIVQKVVTASDATASWKDVFHGLVAEIETAGLKLAALNPLKNWLSGDNKLPTLSDLTKLTGNTQGGAGSGTSSGSAANDNPLAINTGTGLLKYLDIGGSSSNGTGAAAGSAAQSGGWLSGLGSINWAGTLGIAGASAAVAGLLGNLFGQSDIQQRNSSIFGAFLGVSPAPSWAASSAPAKA
ncbi:hypothetical protein [Nitrospirillum sp. BR 11163]|uniref:hypothetical protein n=1 Tax=Nitrospirillum sp. BR 11163 TaxID=3104323 RepID=UPI002B003B37|nr:hypothetical protein [Nitrospirillum sp. BR 11163]MEA1674108.1 hypothetical protein [Nitrospirillum sp. BR 11163]